MSKISDLDLRDVSKARAGAALGSTGVTSLGGYVVSDERLPALTGSKRYETFAQMLNDFSIVATGVRLFLNLISKSTWQVTPADDSAEAKAVAELVEDMMFDHRTAWHRIVRRTAMYKFYGFAIQEWIMKKREDGYIGMADVQSRPQKTIARWDLDDSGELLGCWQQTDSKPEVYLPRERLVYAVDDTLTDHPEGIGLLRHIARATTRLKSFEQIEEVGFESDLRGIPIAYGPWKWIDQEVQAGRMAEAEKTRFRKPMLDFVRGHIRNKSTGMLLDSETYRSNDEAQTPSSVRKWEAELLRGESQAFEPMAGAIMRLNQEIARVLGVEHILLGADGSGSLALSKSKVGTFYLTVMSTQSELVEIMERDWLGPIADANGWDKSVIPDLATEEVRDEDIEQITTALESLAHSGVVLSPEDEAVVECFEMLGLTPPDPMLRDQTPLSPAPDPQLDPNADPVPTTKGIVKFIRSRAKRPRR